MDYSSDKVWGRELMLKRFEDPIQVPTAVIDGLETVRELGQENMLDSGKYKL